MECPCQRRDRQLVTKARNWSQDGVHEQNPYGRQHDGPRGQAGQSPGYVLDEHHRHGLNVRTITGNRQVSPVRIDANSLVALLRPADASPLHTQLENRLRRLIRSGQVGAGSKLPGEIELATRLGLSRHTVRHALAMLVVEGLVRRERGRGGTRVLGPVAAVVARSLNSFYAFAWEVRAQGVEQHSR